MRSPSLFFFFFFNDTATTEIYTLSLHDALPILHSMNMVRKYLSYIIFGAVVLLVVGLAVGRSRTLRGLDRKSTRLNSSHQIISYAVFCLKKKKQQKEQLNKIMRSQLAEQLIDLL